MSIAEHAVNPTPDDRRPRPSVLATEPGRVLLVVALLSLLIHIVIGLVSYDRVLGRIDPSMLSQERPPIRVKRAAYDRFVELDAPGTGAAQAEPEPSLADLSEALLEETAPSASVHDFDPELDLRDLDETLPATSTAELAIDLPAFELSDEMLAAMSARAPGELQYHGSDEAGYGAGMGAADGSGGSGSGAGAGAGSDAARNLLNRAGLIAGAAPRDPLLDRTLIDDEPELDRSVLDVPLAGPDIDFAQLALADTTKLEIPEHLDQDFDYVVTRYTDPRREGEPGWFRVDITPRRSLHKLRTMSKDLVYVVDTSSSVPQDWIREVIAGVQQSLRLLNEGDRFNIVLFSDNPAFFSTQGTVPASVPNIEAGLAFLTSARSDGWTDVNAALSHVLTRDVQSDRVYEVILITDGLPTRGVMDTRELINLITRDNDLATSIYCVGIGRRPNRELLNFLAYRNKGFSIYAEQRDRIAPSIRELGSRLRYPLIKDLRVSVAGRAVSEVYPVDLPNIHQGEQFALFGRFDRPAPFTIQITGSSSGQPVNFSFTRDLSEAPRGDEAVARDWAFWKLHHLYSEIIRQGNQPHLVQQIQQIRDQYRLKTLY